MLEGSVEPLVFGYRAGTDAEDGTGCYLSVRVGWVKMKMNSALAGVSGTTVLGGQYLKGRGEDMVGGGKEDWRGPAIYVVPARFPYTSF
jgi:hypothetical protein